MANTAFLQSSFLGGFWSPASQGRMTDPAWKTALSECLNAYPTEEGPWTRRSGFVYAQHTKKGRFAVLRTFDFQIDAPYVAEFTGGTGEDDGTIRLRQGGSLVRVADGDIHVSGISTATPAVVFLADTIPANWADGDTIMFDLVAIPSSAPILTNRQFTIGTITGNSFTLLDPITDASIDGSTIAYVAGATLDKVFKIFELATPYGPDDLEALRIVSDDSTVLILHSDYEPRVLSVGVAPQPFAISIQEFTDGPYLDIQDPLVSQTTLTLSGDTGSITVTASDTDAINDGQGFLATDVNRLIRFQGGPQMWDKLTAYVKGDQVTGSDGNIYSSQGGLTGVDPTLDDGTHWVLSTAKVNWVWLKITVVTDTTHVTATLQSDLRGAGAFAAVEGNVNIRALWTVGGFPGLQAQYPAIDFTQYFAAGQQVAITNGTFTDPPGGDISGIYTVRGILNDPDDRTSTMVFTDVDGQSASWTTINGLSDSRTMDYSPAVGLNLVGDFSATTAWRLGAFSDTTGHPACGTYHEGRLWLSGAASNRVDASKSDKHFDFTPTDTDGTVADDNAIAATANATELNQFFWMLSGDNGILMGSLAGEWLVQASALNDPISPSSMQMRRVTAYGCADIEPQMCLRTIAFVQRQGRRILDIANYPYGEAAGWFADNLEHLAGTLVCGGVAEIRYQQTPSWNLWVRRNDGTLVGSVFRHAAYGKESFNGWHRHEHGDSRTFESIAVSSTPTDTGLGETLYAVTNQPDVDDDDFGVRWVEMLSPEFDDCSDDCDAFFIDGSAVPANTSILTGGDTPTGIRLYGYWHLNGKTVSAFIGGLDLGDFTVTDGYIDIAFSGTFTWDYFQNLGTCDLTGTSTTTTDSTPVVNPNLGSLEAFVAAGTPVLYDTSAGNWFVDATLALIAETQDDGGDDTGGIQVFNKNTTGDEVAEAINSAVFGVGPANIFVNTVAACIHPNGNYYGACDGITNSVKMACVRLSDQTLLGTTGTANSGFNSSPTNVQCPGTLSPVVKGTHNYLVTGSLAGTEVAVWDLSNSDTPDVMVYVTKVTLSDIVATDGQVFVCEGLRGRGDYYAMGAPDYSGNSTSPIDLYEGWAPEATLRHICSLHGADIDPAWSHTSAASGLGFDAADGNLLFWVQTADTVTHNAYLVKVNRVSGAVMWASVLSGLHGCDLSRCFISGTLQIFDAPNVITIDLSDGSQTITAWNAGLTINVNSIQVFDCNSGAIYLIGSYTHSTGPTPTLIGSYFSGHSTVTTRLLAIYSASDLPPSTETTEYDFFGGVGFTYTSRGQLLRPDFGPDAGAQAGPAFGKMRRIHKAAIALVKSFGLSIGVDFDRLYPVPLKQPNGTDFAAPTLFTGTVAAKDISIDDTDGTDSRLCWEVTRPWPVTVTAIAGFIEAKDE
jgi:hypothetical protein